MVLLKGEIALASRRARRKLAFYYHSFFYLIVNSMLLVINLIQGGKLWFYYPLLGWLLGLLFHAFFTYSRLHALLFKRVVEREINSIENNKTRNES